MSWVGAAPSIGGLIQAPGALFTRYQSDTLIGVFQSVNATEGVYRTIEDDTAGLLRWYACQAYNYTESGGIPSLGAKIYDLCQTGSNVELAFKARALGAVHGHTFFPAHSLSTTATAIVGSVTVRRDGQVITSGESAFVETRKLTVDATYNCYNDNDTNTLEGVLELKLIATKYGAEYSWRFTAAIDLDIHPGYSAMLPVEGTRIASKNHHFVCDQNDGADKNFTGDDRETQFVGWDPDNSPGWTVGIQILKWPDTLRVDQAERRNPVFFCDDATTPGKEKLYAATLWNATVTAGTSLTGSARLVAGKAGPSRHALWTPGSTLPKIGLWIKPSATTAYSDAGTTLATFGGAIQQVNDSSGLGRHITQTTEENQPTLQAGLFPLRVHLSTAGTTEDYMTAPQASPNCLVIWGCVSRSSYSGTTDIYFYDTGNNLAIFNNSANDAINFRDGAATIRSVAGLGDQFAFVWRTGTSGRILTSDGGEITAAMHAADWDTLRVGETVAGGTVLGVAEFGLATNLSDLEMEECLAYLQRTYLQ